MYYNFVSGNYNGSVSGNALMHLIPSHVFTTSSASMEGYNDQPQSSTIIVKKNFISQASQQLQYLFKQVPVTSTHNSLPLLCLLRTVCYITY